MLDAEEAQRRRIARELHDALGQPLTALKLDSAWLAAHLAAGPLRTRALEMEALAAATIAQVRRLSAELRPAILDAEGLLPALRSLVGDFERRSGLHCSLTLPAGVVDWSEARCTTTYRVLQESLNNVAQHARATRVTVALRSRSSGAAQLEVEDDGCGFDARASPRIGALGLLGMDERALLLGGSLTLSRPVGGGSRVMLCLPRERAPAAAARAEARR